MELDRRYLLSLRQLQSWSFHSERSFSSDIRDHHLGLLFDLCLGRDGWQDKYAKMPWSYPDGERFARSEIIAARKSWLRVCELLDQRFLSTQGISNLERSYIDDLIGTTEDSAVKYQHRLFIQFRNFLFTADSADKLFPLSGNPDSICHACIGTGSNIGRHCALIIPEDIAVRTKLEEIVNQAFIVRDNGRLSIKAGAFFDGRLHSAILSVSAYYIASR